MNKLEKRQNILNLAIDDDLFLYLENIANEFDTTKEDVVVTLLSGIKKGEQLWLDSYSMNNQ